MSDAGKLKPPTTTSSGVRLLLGGGVPKTVVPPVLQEVGRLAASVASVSTSSGSATAVATGSLPACEAAANDVDSIFLRRSRCRNPRNKCALQPGHSLMDWIRLGASGKDLTGVGPMAGKLKVTTSELAEHNTPDDCWLSIRGSVYNVTHYLPFHPGGPEQLMTGAGIDATDLFNGVHPWVNFDQILGKCFVGNLVQKVATTIPTDPNKANNPVVQSSSTIQPHVAMEPQVHFDWLQKADSLSLFFYTKGYGNPRVDVDTSEETGINVIVHFARKEFHFHIIMHAETEWPPRIRVNYETGKIEVAIKKITKGIWPVYGQMTKDEVNADYEAPLGELYFVKGKRKVTHDCYLLELTREDGKLKTVPIGHHVRVFDDSSNYRSYTPVPAIRESGLVPNSYTTSELWLLVKRYPEGVVSKYITSIPVGGQLKVSNSFGGYDMETMSHATHFFLFAAGTGITPLLGMINFLLERRLKPSQSVTLLFFNKNERDMILKTELRELAKRDTRFKLELVLTQPSPLWEGHKGRINAELVDHLMNRDIPHDTPHTDIYCGVCGPDGFVKTTTKILTLLHVSQANIVTFPG